MYPDTEGYSTETSSLLPLTPFTDDEGVLRVGGRLRNADIANEAKHQVILPSKHFVTDLIIRECHEISAHSGCEYVLAELRQKYWILKGRKSGKRIINSCIVCRKLKARSRPPLMGDLPAKRFGFSKPPFTYTGLDFFGPLKIKQGRARLKRWGTIFTCMTIRAVHWEVTESLETDTFINTFRRFINRRGKPTVMLSDCGTNFKGADKELKENLKDLNQQKVGNFATSNCIEWRFNPPGSPHMGGAWERLIRSVKHALKVVMKDRIFTDFQLQTLFTEMENILNQRPLTKVSDDCNDFSALTPNHFLHAGVTNNDVEFDEMPCTRKKWQQVQLASSHFWKRWLKEYLPTLTPRKKWRNQSTNLGIGDLVIVKDDDDMSSKRWNLGRIVKVNKGKDGVVRVATVKTAKGVYTRPAVKLFPLEEAQDVEVPQEEGAVPVQAPV